MLVFSPFNKRATAKGSLSFTVCKILEMTPKLKHMGSKHKRLEEQHWWWWERGWRGGGGGGVGVGGDWGMGGGQEPSICARRKVMSYLSDYY